MVEGRQVADVWHADEKDDGDGGGVLGQAHADVPVEQRLPRHGRRQGNGEEAGARGTDDGVEEGGERNDCFGTLELPNGLVEVDYAVEEGEDVGAEVGDVLHGVVVGIEDGQEEVHPARVDQGPGHER